MFFWILQTIIMSFVLIFLVHHLFHFFKSNLTVPKIKDLVNTPTQKYKHMFQVISSNSANSGSGSSSGSGTGSSSGSSSSGSNEMTSHGEKDSDMKHELKSFLKKQLSVPSGEISSTSIASLDSGYTPF